MNLRLRRFLPLLWLCAVHMMSCTNSSEDETNDQLVNRVIIKVGEGANDVEERVALLLRDRLMESSDIEVSIQKASDAREVGTMQIYFGRPEHHPELQEIIKRRRIPLLTDLAPGPEGFLLKRIAENQIIMAGIDDRGCLYAVGEFLRQIDPQLRQIAIPVELDIRSAPAFEIRGTQYGQSHVAKRISGVRDWTPEETQRVILDYALAGANTFSTAPGPMFDFIKSYGLMTQGGFSANAAGKVDNPEWLAEESIGRKGYVCLSVDAARDFMLQKCEDYMKSCPDFDLIKFKGGDGGGCECDKCDPFGLPFITLVEDMAKIVHKYAPNARVYFTNQKFDNDDDNAIFNYLNEQPRDWLWAWGYAPGSDATTWQPGHRQTHRMDLFRYPGFGPYGLYPYEIVRQMPGRHKLVYFNEITHWKYAQHAYIQMYPRADRNGDLPPHWSHDIYERRPDQFLTIVYNRLTFYAWPRQYHRVFNDLMRYSVGDITHSSGHHDHFNQWMWQRLLWSPRQTVEEVVDEYCRTWFGREAAPYMAEAIFQLEENLEEIPGESLPEKEGIARYLRLVREAGENMPEHLMKKNWLWRMYMQKGILDRYVQLDVVRQIRQHKEVERQVANLIDGVISEEDILEVEKLLYKESHLTEQMKVLLLAAGKLGNESDELFGVRSDGYFNLEHDYIGLGWLKRQLSRAKLERGDERRELLQMIVDYENPGEGGYYDNLGTANIAPNVTAGYPYDHGQPYVAQMLSEGNRPSQRSMHFTQDEAQGVTLQYRDLDPAANYKIRFTFVRPWYQERYADRMNQKSQSIYADDILIGDQIELPLQMSDFFTFRIPAEATKDGEMTIRLEKAPDVANGDRVSVEQWRNSGGWGTLVSEVWLMKE